MKLTDDRGVKVYRHDNVSKAGNSYTTYSLGVSSKDKDGNWKQGYLDCQFKKDVELNNKAKIKINNAFPTVNEYNGKTSIRWFVNDFEIVESGENTSNSDAPFLDVSDEEELPF